MQNKTIKTYSFVVWKLKLFVFWKYCPTHQPYALLYCCVIMYSTQIFFCLTRTWPTFTPAEKKSNMTCENIRSEKYRSSPTVNSTHQTCTYRHHPRNSETKKLSFLCDVIPPLIFYQVFLESAIFFDKTLVVLDV